MDAEQICAELDRVRDDYRDLLDTTTVAELRRPTDGTRWSNEQDFFLAACRIRARLFVERV